MRCVGWDEWVSVGMVYGIWYRVKELFVLISPPWTAGNWQSRALTLDPACLAPCAGSLYVVHLPRSLPSVLTTSSMALGSGELRCGHVLSCCCTHWHCTARIPHPALSSAGPAPSQGLPPFIALLPHRCHVPRRLRGLRPGHPVPRCAPPIQA